MPSNPRNIVKIRIVEQAMTPRRWREIEDLYHAARDLKPAARAALLEGTDPELRKEVESLLAHPGSLPDISLPGLTLPGLAGQNGEADLQVEPGSRLGPYRIEGRLGAGGMGEVYRAHDTQLNRAAAIKIVPAALARDPERLARFEREAKALASLNHPNIAQVYGIVEGPDSEPAKARGIAMELVPGADISGPLPVETVIDYAHQIASALEAAHERGIVHRDLKPANIMVTPEGVVKLLDFGLALLSVENPGVPNATPNEQPAVMASPTRAGIILGTAAYMAPEQARGKVVDKRADIWAFGVVLYEISTGKRLFSGETVTDILASIVKDEPDLTRAPQPIRRLLAACLEKDPKRRLRDIADWERLVEEERPPVTQPRMRRVVWMAVLGMTVLALIALAAVHFREESPAVAAMHLTLPLPDTVTGVNYLTLSPDGRTLLLTVTDKDAARSGLALRSLDSDRIRLLPGTGGAKAPFWSPDSKRIAYSELDGRLRIISAGGGPAEVASEIGGCGCGGGTWGAGGVILVVDTNNQIERCEAGQSHCRPLAKDSTLKRAGPVFLPDGKHFLYVVPSALEPETVNRAGVYVASLKDPNGRRLLPDSGRAVYAQGPDGHGFLLFRRDEALVGQAFDLKAPTLSGEVFKIAEEVSRDAGNLMMASVAANGVLAYETGRNVNTQLTWLNRAGKVLSVAGPVRPQHSVALSPQGDRMLVTRGPLGSSYQGLWLRDVARDSESRLIAVPPSGVAGVWAPDGRMVAFSSEVGNLYRRDVSSGVERN